MKELNKSIAVILLGLASCIPTLAKDEINPAEFTKTGHVVAVQTPRKIQERGTQIIVGNLLYDSRNVCKEAEVGSDYPALVEKNKVKLLVGNKVCSYGFRGVTEVK